MLVERTNIHALMSQLGPDLTTIPKRTGTIQTRKVSLVCLGARGRVTASERVACQPIYRLAGTSLDFNVSPTELQLFSTSPFKVLCLVFFRGHRMGYNINPGSGDSNKVIQMEKPLAI